MDATSDAAVSDASSTDASMADASSMDAAMDSASPDAAFDDGSAMDAASDAAMVDAGVDAAAFDPQPASCDAGGMPAPVGGTLACPDDKNLPGCPCSSSGATASCFTGLRVNRDHGICQDGMSTCTSTNGQLEWGACNGEVLPTMGAAPGSKAACSCFSTGHWQVDNLAPCFVFSDPSQTTVSVAIASDGATMMCPNDLTMPPATWSTDTLTVDCPGAWQLCYTFKAGDPKNPHPTDCIMARSCTSITHYDVANVAQAFPPLPGWMSDASMAACAQQFVSSGGYGEMSVSGQSDECELVSKVFQRVTYCPLSCNVPNPPPTCAACQAGGGGPF
jgi:hypothetical protein